MMTRRKTRSSLRSRDEGEAFERIPFDLVIEIILRLPVKSVGRFRCVSKQWNSTFRGSYFIDTFFTRSSFPPKILFTCLKDGETFFFSSPQPQDTLSPIAADIHMSFPVNCPTNIYRPVRGLLCGLNQRTSKGKTVTMPLLCNPSTGESFALPRVRTRKKGVISYFGYDPIDKDFKVLCMTRSHVPPYVSEKHQVLTVGTEKKWRMIECDILHDPVAVEDTNIFSLYDGICINGVVYYLAILQLEGVGDGFPDIVSFDIKSEKFSYIKKAYGEGMMLNSGADLESTLVNYKGKLAKLQPNTVDDLYTEIYNGIQLWVLENAEKHEWSSYIYVLPPPWKNIFEETTLCFVATTSKGEIVLSPNTISDSFYLIYYNPEKDTITKVGIQGMEAFKGYKAYTFLDHVEDVTLVSKGFGSWARLVT